ncbi:MAG: lysine 5,6-aminomutase subunit alpha [Filifactoraceae bacterium]
MSNKMLNDALKTAKKLATETGIFIKEQTGDIAEKIQNSNIDEKLDGLKDKAVEVTAMAKKKANNMSLTMNSKLHLDFDIVDEARETAKRIAADTQLFIDKHTTVAVERTICRLLGIDGVDSFNVPLPNIVVDNIEKGNGLSTGVAVFIGNAMLNLSLSPQAIAEKVASGELNLTELPMKDIFEIKMKINEIAKASTERIANNRKEREAYLEKYGDKTGPYLYVIVATGNIYEDITQAVAAAKQGADIIAVIRTTGQSLLDYVPYGATTEGFGGTYATQENFRLMRAALDEVGSEVGRYIRLCNYCSGLCMPEIAAMGAFERLDVMLNDALYGILFRDINMKRTMVDQYFSRIINGFAGVIINTGEDNYLTTADAYEEAHTVLASQFINEQFALVAGLPEEQMGLGHAFEMDPELKNAFVYELAQAQMAREIFPKAPLKYMPPTKFMTGDIFKGQIQDSLFNMVTIMTGQKLCLLGMLTEAIHTPFMSDRAVSIENAQYIFNTMEDFGSEIEFKRGGLIQNRANEVLAKANELIKEIEKNGLFSTLEKGIFGGVKRPIDGGKGLSGVTEKSENYFNPFIELMLKK